MSEASPALVWARRITAAIAGLWLVLSLVAFALRLTFPLELEWMEGGTLHQAHRVRAGLPVYGPPSADFVPFLYTPLYPWLLAKLGAVLPLNYALARGVSVVAVIAIWAGLWRLVRDEGKTPSHAAAAVGLFAAGYVFGFRWLDVGRGDALFLALCLWGLVLLRHSDEDRDAERPGANKALRGWLCAVGGGVLVALAFWTKQTAAIFVLASGVAGLLVSPRRVWAYAGTIALIDGGGVLLGQALTEGWLWTWIYETHQTHAFNAERFEKKTWGMFAHSAPALVVYALILASAGVGGAWARGRELWRERSEGPLRRAWLLLREARATLYWGLLAGAGLLVSALGYSTQFAEPNAFIPGVCFVAALLGVSLPAAEKGGVWRSRLELLGLGAFGVQMLFALAVEPMYQPIQSHGLREGLADSYAWQDPQRTVPTRAQRDRARALRERVEGLDGGELLALSRPWWSTLAGGPGHVGTMGINDVDPEARKALQGQLRQDLREGRFSAVWIEGRVPGWLANALRGWSVAERRHGDARVRPMTGYMSEAGMVSPWRGEQLLLVREPVEPDPPPEGAVVLADFESGRLEGVRVESGLAFGRRAARGYTPGLPPVGPHGGRYLLSSGHSRGRLEAEGVVVTEPFTLSAGSVVELAVGTSGARKGLAIELHRVDAAKGEAPVHRFELPRTHYDLQPVRWTVPEALDGEGAQLRLVDGSGEAALFVDDIRLLAP